MLLDLGEVPGTRQGLVRPVQVPGHAVERAAQLGDAPGRRAQLPPAVQAGVEVGLDLVRRGAHDDQVVVADLVEVVVADLGDVVGAAGELPHLAPDLLHLAVVPLPRDVAVDRQVLRAEVVVAVVEQHGRNGSAVVAQVLLHADALGAQARFLLLGLQVGGRSRMSSLRIDLPVFVRRCPAVGGRARQTAQPTGLRGPADPADDLQVDVADLAVEPDPVAVEDAVAARPGVT